MIVFDMAGTTVDEDNVVYKTLQWAIQKAGINVSLEQVLVEGAGKEKLNAIHDILTSLDIQDVEVISPVIHRDFLIQLDEAYLTLDVKGMPHAEDVFSKLRERGILVVLNTGYNRQIANQLLDKIGWKISEHYDLLVTATDVTKCRPSPDMIQFAIDYFDGIDSSTIIKVGDSTVDVEEGINAKCLYSIGITTGAQTRAQLETAQPEFIINDLIELLDIVN
jgi:phosphonatase-like hydrolase